MFLVFGIAFVLPVFLVALNLAGVVTGRQLLKAWRPVILGAFLFAAIATPSGDPYTMTALAVPMLVLYYTAAGLALLTDRRRRRAGIDGLDYAALDDDEASPLTTGRRRWTTARRRWTSRRRHWTTGRTARTRTADPACSARRLGTLRA